MTEVWQSGYVEASGLRLHFTRTGSDKPPLILVHGVTDAGPCWSAVAEALAPDYDAIMVDARGHGLSDAPDRGYGPVEQAEDLAAIIAALELNQPAILGHSMGAATTLVLAGMYPDLPGAILLEDPPAWWTDWTATPVARERLAGMRQRFTGLKRKTREELLDGQRAEQAGWSNIELEPWADAKQRFSLNVLRVLDQDTASAVNWPVLMRRIICPALLITADPELGAIVTAESAAALGALVPHLEIAHIPEAGHNIRRDQFARYMEVVRGFLVRKPERGGDDRVLSRTDLESLHPSLAGLAARCPGRFQQPRNRLEINLLGIRVPDAALTDASPGELGAMRSRRVALGPVDGSVEHLNGADRAFLRWLCDRHLGFGATLAAYSLCILEVRADKATAEGASDRQRNLTAGCD